MDMGTDCTILELDDGDSGLLHIHKQIHFICPIHPSQPYLQ